MPSAMSSSRSLAYSTWGTLQESVILLWELPVTDGGGVAGGGELSVSCSRPCKSRGEKDVDFGREPEEGVVTERERERALTAKVAPIGIVSANH